jgi:hypothetical protein
MAQAANAHIMRAFFGVPEELRDLPALPKAFQPLQP